MTDERPSTRRRRVVIGYCASACVFVTLNTAYWLLFEHRLGVALLTPVAPLLFGLACVIALPLHIAASEPLEVAPCVAGSVVVILLTALGVSMFVSLRRSGGRRSVLITHGCLVLYYVACYVFGKMIIWLEEAIAC